MSLQPINTEEVMQALDRRMNGFGNGAGLARELGMEPSHLRSIRSGYRRMNQKIAAKLGYELRWVKVRKGE